MSPEPTSQQGRVAVVGFGYVGSILAAHLCQMGIRVIGIDADPAVVRALEQGNAVVREQDASDLLNGYVRTGQLHVSTDKSLIADADVVIVTVGTPLSEEYQPDLSHFRASCLEIAAHLRPGHLVILKSTVTIGATEDAKRTLEARSGLASEADFFLAYCPERLAEGAQIHDFTGSALKLLRQIPVVVSAVGPRSRAAAEAFWRRAGLKTVPVSSPETAELVKLADNWWIDLNIAMANEVGKLCEMVGVDALEVIRAANTLPKGDGLVNILFPGAGVGGDCLPKDPWFIYHQSQAYGLDLKTPMVSRQINDSMPAHMFGLTQKTLEECGKSVSGSKVAVLGVAFKNGTNDTRNTPARELVRLLREAGATVVVFDPWVDEQEAARQLQVGVASSVGEAVSDADALVLVTPQPEFREIRFNEIAKIVSMPCGVVDGRRAFRREEVLRAGFRYRAVGLGVRGSTPGDAE